MGEPFDLKEIYDQFRMSKEFLCKKNDETPAIVAVALQRNLTYSKKCYKLRGKPHPPQERSVLDDPLQKPFLRNDSEILIEAVSPLSCQDNSLTGNQEYEKC
jgi:hypothetical protein